MRKSKFTETQIVKGIKDHETGRNAVEASGSLPSLQLLFTNGANVMVVWR